MIIRRFRREEHEDFGEHGWLLVGAPSTYVPLWGMGVAHDLIEHRRNDTGTVEEELMALGAALHVRGEGGYWYRYGSRREPGDQISSDISYELGIKYGGITDGISDPGRTHRLEEHVEEWIASAIRSSRKEIVCLEEFAAEDGISLTDVEQYLRRAVGWLRRGFRAAVRRYSGISPYSLSTLFSQVEQEAGQLLKDDMSAYCEMVIRLDVQRASVQVYLDESGLEDDYYG